MLFAKLPGASLCFEGQDPRSGHPRLVEGLGFLFFFARLWGLGFFRAWGSAFRAWGLGFRGATRESGKILYRGS